MPRLVGVGSSQQCVWQTRVGRVTHWLRSSQQGHLSTNKRGTQFQTKISNYRFWNQFPRSLKKQRNSYYAMDREPCMESWLLPKSRCHRTLAASVRHGIHSVPGQHDIDHNAADRNGACTVGYIHVHLGSRSSGQRTNAGSARPGSAPTQRR